MNFKATKSIYEYDNYRQFLRDVCENARARAKKYSFRFFAKLAGFATPNHFQRVIEGKRNLSAGGISKIAKALKFNNEENIFFQNLVFLNQASSSGERECYAQAILRSRAYKRIFPVKESQYNFWSKWYFAVIREMIGLPGFREDYEWICKKIQPQISLSEAKKAVEEMLALEILERGPKGELRQTNAFIMSTDEVTSSSAARFHREMMNRASEAIDRVPREKRELSTLTLGISSEKAREIKEMIQDFRKRLMEVAASDSMPKNVYQLNFHLFPLVELKEDESK